MCVHITHISQSLQSPPSLLHLLVGDSYTVGFANTGGTTMCNKTACSPVTGLCNPELDSQNAAIAWGPLTASHFDADFQVIAWSGAEVVTPDLAESLGAEGIPFWEGEEIFPLDSQIWTRQVEADNSSMVANFSSWVPQVGTMLLIGPPLLYPRPRPPYSFMPWHG